MALGHCVGSEPHRLVRSEFLKLFNSSAQGTGARTLLPRFGWATGQSFSSWGTIGRSGEQI